MTTAHDHQTARLLPGVRREVRQPVSDFVDQHLDRQRHLLSSCLGGAAVVFTIAGFFASALWVIAAFLGFAALIASKASAGYQIEPPSSFVPIETGASRELQPGTAEWHIRMRRDFGE